MSFYENVFIARQDVSSAQVDSMIETFEKIITDMGGSLPRKELWGLRTMAYKIKKNRKGHYVFLNIDAPSKAIHEMERQMQLNEDILRFLTTRVEILEEEPSAIMRAKERGDDRERQYSQDDDQDFSEMQLVDPEILQNIEEETETFEDEMENVDSGVIENTLKDLDSPNTSVEEVKNDDVKENIEGETK